MSGSIELLDWIATRDPLAARPWHIDDSSLWHDMGSDNVELFWIPLLGPSATLALRRLWRRPGPMRTQPVALHDFAERYLADFEVRGNTSHQKPGAAQWLVVAAHTGVEPDYAGAAGWWRNQDLCGSHSWRSSG